MVVKDAKSKENDDENNTDGGDWHISGDDDAHSCFFAVNDNNE